MRVAAEAFRSTWKSRVARSESKSGSVVRVATAKEVAASVEKRQKAKIVSLLDDLRTSINFYKQGQFKIASSYRKQYMEHNNSTFDSKSRPREFLRPLRISRHLRCSICQEVFEDPVLITCGHTFCYLCIERWVVVDRRCPLCKRKILRKSPERDLIAYSLIEDLPSICRFPTCRWRGLYSQVKKHQATCNFRPKKVIRESAVVIPLEDSSPQMPSVQVLNEKPQTQS